MTKEERAAYAKRYREEHREQIRANRIYNRDKNNSYRREYYLKHCEEELAKMIMRKEDEGK